MGGLVDRELTLASGKQKEKKVIVGRGCGWVNDAGSVLCSCFDLCVICQSTYGKL